MAASRCVTMVVKCLYLSVQYGTRLYLLDLQALTADMFYQQVWFTCCEMMHGC